MMTLREFFKLVDMEGRCESEAGGGGGKSAPAAPPPPPVIAPTAPVEEASVEVDEDQKKKTKTGKSSLKVPLTTSSETGLKL